MRTLVIANPASGHGSAGERIPELEAVLKKHDIEYQLTRTEKPWHATELAERAMDRGFDVVAIAGGDGTANEAINGLMRMGDGPESRPVLHCFCIGRGNDFAYGAGIPSDIDTATQMLKVGSTSLLDVGFLKGGDYPDGRFFGNGIGIGFDAIVGFKAAELKNLTGFPAYAVAALKTFLMYPDAPEIDLKTSSAKMHLQTHQISVMNGQRMGGGFYMAPEADVSDGLFDLCMSKKLNRRQMFSHILKFMKGSQNDSKYIITERGTTFAVTCPHGGLAAHADGETICTDGTSIEVTCLPAQLRVVSSS